MIRCKRLSQADLVDSNAKLQIIFKLDYCYSIPLSWSWVVKDNPEEDRNITDQELEYLRTAIGVSNQESQIIVKDDSIATNGKKVGCQLAKYLKYFKPS